MNKEIELGEKYRAEITEKISNIKKVKEEIEKVLKERLTEYDQNKILETQKEQIKDIPQVRALNKINLSLLDYELCQPKT